MNSIVQNRVTWKLQEDWKLRKLNLFYSLLEAKTNYIRENID